MYKRQAEVMGKSCWEMGLHPMDEEAWAIFKTAHPLVDSDTGLQYYETHTTIQKKDGCKLPITVKIFPTKIGDEMEMCIRDRLRRIEQILKRS